MGTRWRACILGLIIAVGFAGMGCRAKRDQNTAAEPQDTSASPAASNSETSPSTQGGATRSILDMPSAAGVSGLAIDPAGGFWSITERQRVIIPFAWRDGRGIPTGSGFPLEGIDAGTDTESLAWLAPGKLAAGTETQAPSRKHDDILVLEQRGTTFEVTEHITMPYRLWNIEAEVNRGIEGLCAAGNVLLAVIETTGEYNGRRFAVMGRYNMGTQQWTPFRVWLTSETGRPSSIECRRSSDGTELEALMIERHYGVSRLLSLRVPLADKAGGDITPVQLVDLAALAGKPALNFEGVAWVNGGSGDVLVLADNDTGGASGPTELLLIPSRQLMR